MGVAGLFSVVDGRSVSGWLLDLGDAFSAERRDGAVAALALGDAEVASVVLLRLDPMNGSAVTFAQQTTLAAMGEAAVEPLVRESGRAAAWEAPLVSTLAAIGAPAVPALRRCVDDAGLQVHARVRALRALAAMRPQPDGVGEALVAVMYAPGQPEGVRVAAAAGVASWARPWVEADQIGATLLASCADRDAQIGVVSQACDEAQRIAEAVRAVAAGPPLSGWSARRDETSGLYTLERFVGREWTGTVAAAHLGENTVTSVLAHAGLLGRLGDELAAAARDAALLGAVEHEEERASAAGYGLVPARLAEGAAAAGRLRQLGARLRDASGADDVAELADVLSELAGSREAARARELLLGGTWFLE